MHELLASVAWIFPTLAGIGLGVLGASAFTRAGRNDPRFGLLLLGLLIVGVLGADWVVHPVAGMLLGAFATFAFERGRPLDRGALLVVAALVACAFLGAAWVAIPLVIMAAVAFMVRGGQGLRLAGSSAPVQALPADAGGERWPDLSARLGERRERVERRIRKLEGKRARLLGEPPAARPPAEPTGPATAAPLTGLLALAQDARLPEEARTRLLTLHVRCAEAEGYLRGEREAAEHGAAYTLAQIRGSYAPDSARAYLRLPRSLADTEVLEGGQTGKALLLSQLDLLTRAVDDLEREAAQSGSQDLLVQQRFLRERFGKRGGGLEG